jgi:RNA polymerase sigma-70 factor (ECF subfamily)
MARVRGRAEVDPSEDDLTTALAAALGGDEYGFRVLYRAVQPGLLRYLRLLVGGDAEDVASEAWLQIARDLNRFHGDVAGFRGWATSIARHRALDLIRRQGRRPVSGGQLDEFAAVLAARENTADSAVESITTDAALALIGTLPPDQAEAVLLRVVMGLDGPAAAKVLGKRPGAVRTATHRGLRALAERIATSAAEASTVAPAGRGTRVRAKPGVTPFPPPALKEVR